jgi:hypothetical protein
MRYGLIAIALAVLALASAGHGDARAAVPFDSATGSCRLAAQPAPDLDQPAIVRAAVTPPAHAQSQLDCAARALSHPVTHAWTFVRETVHDPAYDISRPRTFPLLI